MRSEPVVPAEVSRTPEGAPFADAFGDVYHPPGRAFEQAREVFLEGNGLPERWQGRDSFVVLETGFGLGNNFLATWEAWRNDPRRSRRLVFVSIERHPLRRDDLAAMLNDSPLATPASQLVDAWPPLTPDLHRRVFDDGAVELLLAFGDVAAWLPELLMQVDAFFLDGFAPAKNPQMWQPRMFKALARLAAPGATAATWSSASQVRQGLATAGFEVTKMPGSGGKWHTTRARYAPAFVPRHAPARRAVPAHEKRAVIVGAGLAGCSAAAALARQGWHSVLLDRHDGPAQETSGNPAGLFHSTVHAEDGPHTRFNRAAALWLQPVVAALLRRDASAGSLQGLLRIENERGGAAAMQAMLDRLRLPADHVQAIDAVRSSELAGFALGQPAWFYPGGGWVRPGALAAHWLAEAGPLVRWRGNRVVERLERVGERWCLLDARGEAIDECETVVLANAGDALRLLGRPDWPVEAVRGQLSNLPASAWAQAPRIPVAGAGYVLPAIDGRVAFGATAQPGDDDTKVRDADHDANLAQLGRLGAAPDAVDRMQLAGRTGWRWVARDRLPLIGAVPDFESADAMARPLDQARFVPRKAGLFVFSGLASRGIAWSALGGEVLASWVCGSPCPLEASLVDAVDPARFGVRALRRGTAPTPLS